MRQKRASHSFFDIEGPIAIAHRGGVARYETRKHLKENTMNALKAATELGYQYLEIDVALTKDNKLIALHVTVDPIERNLLRKSAPNALKIQQLTYEKLKSKLERDVPTLEEIFEAFPTTKFMIDPKTDKTVEPLAKTVIRADACSRVLIGSFYLARVLSLKEMLGPKAGYCMIINRYPKLFNSRLKRLKQGDYFEIGLTAIALPHKFMTQALVDSIQKKGLGAIIWTANTEHVMQKAIAFGVDGIVSDNIELLKRVLFKINPKNQSISE